MADSVILEHFEMCNIANLEDPFEERAVPDRDCDLARRGDGLLLPDRRNRTGALCGFLAPTGC